MFFVGKVIIPFCGGRMQTRPGLQGTPDHSEAMWLFEGVCGTRTERELLKRKTVMRINIILDRGTQRTEVLGVISPDFCDAD